MRVAIVEDALLVREGLVRLLRSGAVEVAAAVGSFAELRPRLDDTLEVVIMDIRLPPTYRTEGIAAATELATTHPRLSVLVLSQYREPDYARALLTDTPARRGYLLKESVLDRDQLVGALFRLAAGDTVVDPNIVASAIAAAPRERLGGLTERELDILRLIAEGLTDRGISEALVLSPRTVATHVRHIFAKLALPDSQADNRRVHAVLAYLVDTATA